MIVVRRAFTEVLARGIAGDVGSTGGVGSIGSMLPAAEPAPEPVAEPAQEATSVQVPVQGLRPAQGLGLLGLEARAGWCARDQTGPDVGMQATGIPAELLRFVLDDAPSSAAARAERAFAAAIEAGRTVPVGVLAEIDPPVAGPPGDIMPVAGGAPTVGMIDLRLVVASPGDVAVLRRAPPVLSSTRRRSGTASRTSCCLPEHAR